MRYFGGKARTAKQIVGFLDALRTPNQLYFEPFVGGANVVTLVGGRRACADKNDRLIAMYKAIQIGWEPPKNVSEELYQKAKQGTLSPELTAFIGFGCSFAGKWFGGYAGRGERNYALNAYNSITKKAKTLSTVAFYAKDYREFKPKGCLIYCDPPYQGTTQYGAVGDFDSEEFWAVMRDWSVENTVVVSEYSAPLDFECVLEIPTKLDIRNREGVKESRTEKLFMRSQHA